MDSIIEIVGTSHIAKHSKKLIKEKFLDLEPDIIAVELDKNRLQSLLNPQNKNLPSPKLIFSVGFVGYLFVLLGSIIQKKLGSSVGVMPGEDMLYAVQLAKNNKLDLALIDRPIQITLRRLSKQFTFKEKFKVLVDILKIPFQFLYFLLLPKKSKKKLLQSKSKKSFSLNEVPGDDVIQPIMDLLEKRYPSLFKVLITERNYFMMRRLVILTKKNPNKKILAVVGAGHKKGMLILKNKLLREIEVV